MTIDYSRQGRSSKRKGENGEREVQQILRDHGWDRTHRNLASGGSGGSDLVESIPDVAIEVKRTETCSLPAWWRQACAAARPTDSVWIVHRGSQQPWMATLTLSDVMGLDSAPLFDPTWIGARDSVRAEFMHAHKTHPSHTSRPMVVHPLGTDRRAMATVLLEHLLEGWPS